MSVTPPVLVRPREAGTRSIVRTISKASQTHFTVLELQINTSYQYRFDFTSWFPSSAAAKANGRMDNNNNALLAPREQVGENEKS